MGAHEDEEEKRLSKLAKRLATPPKKHDDLKSGAQHPDREAARQDGEAEARSEQKEKGSAQRQGKG